MVFPIETALHIKGPMELEAEDLGGESLTGPGTEPFNPFVAACTMDLLVGQGFVIVDTPEED